MPSRSGGGCVTGEEVEERVMALLRDEYPVLQGAGLAYDTALVSTGLMDSFAVVMLIASLEEIFDVELDVESLDLDHFETPRAIATLCASVRAGRG